MVSIYNLRMLPRLSTYHRRLANAHQKKEIVLSLYAETFVTWFEPSEQETNNVGGVMILLPYYGDMLCEQGHDDDKQLVKYEWI